MNMKVLKFGGTSVGTPDMIRRVTEIVRDQSQLDKLIVVLSAFSGVTNRLESLAHAAEAGQQVSDEIATIRHRHIETIETLITDPEKRHAVLTLVDSLCTDVADICRGISLVKELSKRSLARLLSAGELLSSNIITAFLAQQEIDCSWQDSRAYFVTEGDVLNGAVVWNETQRRLTDLSSLEARIVVMPGFIARNKEGHTTTLGRGGSDYTAAIIAGTLPAEALEIWTDVNGVMTADPRLVSRAHPIGQLSYAEAMELSFFGAKVIYPPTIHPLIKHEVPLWIKNTMNPADHGTVIDGRSQEGDITVKGITCISDISLVTISGAGMVGVPGTAMRLFRALSDNAVNVLFITQSSSEHTITVGLDRKDAAQAVDVLRYEFQVDIERGNVDAIDPELDLSLIAAVGDNMKNRPGIAGKLFGLLGDNGINIRAIAQGSTERNVSFVVKGEDTRKALNVLHEGFFLSQSRVIHLFNIGVGNVGATMLDQLQQQADSILDGYNVEMRIAGLANSTKMLLQAQGIPLDSWKSSLHDGDHFNAETFVRSIRQLNLRNSIFIDNTASAAIADLYLPLLQANTHVVASNKIAASSPFENYELLKKTAAERGVQFLFETNVAAGLPVIKTIRDMLLTGDRIHRIEAVLSGSLNYIFNTISSECKFSEAVTQARELGLTEPDPAIDLSGLDVQRKILILAREAGFSMNMQEVGKEFMLPDSVEMGLPWKDLLARLQDQDASIEKQRAEIAGAGKAWRFMAVMADGKASVGIRAITEEHPAWHLGGKDNLVLIYSDRYSEQPMVVKGAGAGPQVTASGVLADILRIVNV
jgi:aspartokinase/homoserine dehydrogenase 1